jgi:hypothetical protein
MEITEDTCYTEINDKMERIRNLHVETLYTSPLLMSLFLSACFEFYSSFQF